MAPLAYIWGAKFGVEEDKYLRSRAIPSRGS